MSSQKNYIEGKILELATSKWLFQNLQFAGERISPDQRKYLDFTLMQVFVESNQISILGAFYKNQIFQGEYQSAHEAAALVFDHLRYVDTNYQRLQLAPEDYVKKSFFKKVFERLAK
ncbi:hypothetical protein ACES2L_04760 [Bdellovibrio bacteriovorus]